MKLYSSDTSELMNVTRIKRSGDDLLIKGKVFNTMPMAAKLTPDEARKLVQLIDLRTALFILSLLFRRSKKRRPPPA
ncbi:MAG: hypothetical protein JWN59_793 [Sphingomonas bacterium]|nr:hypothetical protein [Sphingomonas bacterium]